MWDLVSKVMEQKGGIPFLIGFSFGILVTLVFAQSKYYNQWFLNEKKESGIVADSTKMEQPMVDLQGAWVLTNTIHAANDSKYHDSELKFKMFLRQEKSELSGTIVKFKEGNSTIPEKKRKTIELKKAEVKGYKVNIQYIENGKEGKFEWVFNSENKKLVGSFTSDVASSKGKSEAYRLTCSDCNASCSCN